LVSKQRFAPKLWLDIFVKVVLALAVTMGQMGVYQQLAARIGK
jgi:hypothetical protein